MPGLRKLCWKMSTDESSAEFSTFPMAIDHSIQGHPVNTSQTDTKGDTHVFHHEVGVLLFDIFGEASILELGDATTGKVFTWHTFLWCHGFIISPAQRQQRELRPA